MTIINRKAELRVASKVDLWDQANIRLNGGKESVIDKMYKIMPSIKKNGVDCKSFTFEEEKIFMPDIIGVSVNSPDFSKRCRLFWQSIWHEFDQFGEIFDISFEVDDDKVSQFNNAPENKKYLYGMPVNIHDYLLYRYCLEWSAVANSYSIYKEHKHVKRIKYYFYTESEVKAEQHATLNLQKSAMQAFLKAIDDSAITEGVLRYFERNKVNSDIDGGFNQTYVYDDLDDDGKQQMLMELSKTASKQFVDLVNDSDLPIRTFIYKCMQLRVLTQLPGSSMVMFGDETIGRTMDEAIVAIKTRPEIKNEITLRAKAAQSSAK